MGHYRHVTLQEFMLVQAYTECGYAVGEIAIRLGRHHSSVGRWIHRFQDAHGGFNAATAWQQYAHHKHIANSHPKILSNDLLKQFILEKITTYWSPEQIAGRWKTEQGLPLSHETIYQYIYRYHPAMVKLFFRRKGKKYRHRRQEELQRKYQIQDMRMITERPSLVEERLDIGHWEGDTVMSVGNKAGIVTNVERKTGFLLAQKIPSKHAEVVADITADLFAELPNELRVTLTVDQGKEFAWHRLIEAQTQMSVYFCHKSSPWERGTNENTNGLLRYFFPKGRDFTQVTETELQRAVTLLNNRPRKRHNYLTPAEVLRNELALKIPPCSSL